MDDTPEDKYTPEVARILRVAFERLACKIERFNTNGSYKGAFKIAARLIRESKPD